MKRKLSYRGFQAEFIKVPAFSIARCAAVYQEQTDAMGRRLSASARPSHHDHKVTVDTVGDKDLAAIDNPVCAILHRRGADTLQVAKKKNVKTLDNGGNRQTTFS